MLFNSLSFLVFLPIFLVAYFSTRGRGRLWVSLVGSYVFYAWWDWRCLSLLWISTAIDYFAAIWIEDTNDARARKGVLTLSMVSNLTLLGIFKYFGFFAESLADLLRAFGMQADAPTLKIILPAGISFYTFQTMSYTIDVYRRRMPATRSLLEFAVFVAFFPQLVAGPILRASLFVPQLQRTQPFAWSNVISGTETALRGYFLKVVVADSLALVVDRVMAHPERETALSLMIAVLFFSYQIYCDFSGYSMIAIGLGRIMGFDFGVNFDRPYFSASLTELWQRWHISLSSWIRDYLYRSLGGTRRYSPVRTVWNLFVTMFLTGLWHGAAWTYVVWAQIHLGGLLVQLGWRMAGRRLRRVSWPSGLPGRALGILLVQAVHLPALVFFRAPDLGAAAEILGRIFRFDGMNFFHLPARFLVVKGLLLIAVLWGIEAASFTRFRAALDRPWVRWLAAALILWSLPLLGTFRGRAFIYFQF